MDSIDIFDTAIFRDVYEPKDIFKLLEKQLGSGFAQKRIDAEKKAHERYKFPTLKEIYSYLPGIDSQKEIDMELQHIYPNNKILNMYKENPKNYVFISDMYLPAHVLVKMLEKCGYENPKVFVSCEQRCNKGSGALFERVKRYVGRIEKHYGDNYKSDIEGCLKQGIKPVFEQALHKIPMELPMVKNPLLKKYSAALHVSKEAPITKMAKYFAPLIYGFTKWVISKKKPGQTIYFLSRDMFMPYLISKTFLRQTDVKYLYCSRRSLAPLYIASGDKELLDKMHIVLTPEEFRQKKQQGTRECMQYLKDMGIKDGDMIVDIGYSGSTQRVIEKSLNIKLKGLYMQLDQVPKTTWNMDMEMYLNRFALLYRFWAEFIMTSPEDCIEDYRNGRVVVETDNEIRKQYAKHINSVIVNETLFKRIDRMDLDIFDIEQMIIFLQQNPTDEMLQVLNQPILTNRQKQERCINFNKSSILNGQLFNCYRRSYAKPLFKRMLLNDPDLCSLVSILPD